MRWNLRLGLFETDSEEIFLRAVAPYSEFYQRRVTHFICENSADCSTTKTFSEIKSLGKHCVYLIVVAVIFCLYAFACGANRLATESVGARHCTWFSLLTDILYRCCTLWATRVLEKIETNGVCRRWSRFRFERCGGDFSCHCFVSDWLSPRAMSLLKSH